MNYDNSQRELSENSASPFLPLLLFINSDEESCWLTWVEDATQVKRVNLRDKKIEDSRRGFVQRGFLWIWNFFYRFPFHIQQKKKCFIFHPYSPHKPFLRLKLYIFSNRYGNWILMLTVNICIVPKGFRWEM